MGSNIAILNATSFVYIIILVVYDGSTSTYFFNCTFRMYLFCYFEIRIKMYWNENQNNYIPLTSIS